MKKASTFLLFLAVCSVIANMFVSVPVAKASPSCKHLNAECTINESDHNCCPGLTCEPFNDSSGNGKCVTDSTTADPTSTPTPTESPADNQEPVDVNIPEFPLCPLTENGDWAHYDTGWHQIVGGSLLPGRDDVYSLDNGNYLQCYCNPQTGAGIQTNWFRTETPVPGWFQENGSQWNLGNYSYSAQNLDYNCSETTPTPTPEGTPAPTPTIENTPIPTTGTTSGGGSNNPGGPYVCSDEKPGTPVLLSLVQTGSSMKLTWSPADKATTYDISYGTDPANYQFGVINVGNVTEYTIGSLDPGQKYYASVMAVNGCMPGDSASVMPGGLGTGGGEVLGASTLASTGTQAENAAFLSIISGMLMMTISAYAKKTKIYPQKTA